MSMLPNRKHAQVDRRKICDYLLSATHPDGRSKAMYFMRFGFVAEDWQVLAEALRLVGVSNPVVSTVESPFGVRYTVDGLMKAPDGRSPRVRTVWIVSPDGTGPRLVTAFPV